MRKLFIIFLLVGISVASVGCGETISGAGKDVNRMGKGLSTFLFRQ